MEKKVKNCFIMPISFTHHNFVFSTKLNWDLFDLFYKKGTFALLCFVLPFF